MDNIKVKKEKINKKTLGIIIGIVLGVITVISISYAYWNITYNQEDSNVVTTDCFLIDFEEENDISLLETNPIIDEEVSSLTPYTFTIRNTCTMNATYQINLEVIEGTTLDHSYIRTELNNTKSNLVEYGEVEPTIENATNSYKMYESILASGSEMTFNLKEWIKEVDPSDSEWMSKIFKSKVTITFSPYLEELPNIEYAYTGDVQEFTAPEDGYYNIELWGAGSGGKGGYTSGKLYLEKDEILYVHVGQGGSTLASVSYNGGGVAGYDYCDTGGGASYRCGHGYYKPGGGGATDVRLSGGAWTDNIGLRSRIMVAGGGGGSGAYGSIGGVGGNLYGNNGTSGRYNSSHAYPYSGGRGGTQTGVVILSGTANTSKPIYNGASATTLSYNVGYVNASYVTGGGGGRQFGFVSGGGGGGGYYGGGGGWGEYAASSGGGGGSSYISGYAGSNSVTSATSTVHTNNTLHYSGKYFIDTKMESGINAGNGKAKISYIGEPQRTNTNLDNVRYIKSCLNGSSANADNHWVEIQAIKNGVNLAKGILAIGTTTQHSSYTYNRITDGNIDTNIYAQSSVSGLQCVTIDLGEVYNLDEIGLWGYWSDGRRYNDNILSVGETNTSGTASLSTILHNYLGTTGYNETSQGRRYTAWD